VTKWASAQRKAVALEVEELSKQEDGEGDKTASLLFVFCL
jgi:hypothetical protein